MTRILKVRDDACWGSREVPAVDDEIRVQIQTDQDIVAARQKGRARALAQGFSALDAILLATAISELARNIASYAKKGEILIRTIPNLRDGSARPGIQVVARDRGPGIRDVEQALRVGFSTSGSLGLGLPGVKRLADEFQIESVDGGGTTVTIRKWR